jgi:hypothetical protein
MAPLSSRDHLALRPARALLARIFPLSALGFLKFAAANKRCYSIIPSALGEQQTSYHTVLMTALLCITAELPRQ